MERPEAKSFSELLLVDLVLAARLRYFRIRLLIASLESIAIALGGPTPHQSCTLFTSFRHEFAHV
jgi:hypothetical protein